MTEHGKARADGVVPTQGKFNILPDVVYRHAGFLYSENHAIVAWLKIHSAFFFVSAAASSAACSKAQSSASGTASSRSNVAAMSSDMV